MEKCSSLILWWGGSTVMEQLNFMWVDLLKLLWGNLILLILSPPPLPLPLPLSLALTHSLAHSLLQDRYASISHILPPIDESQDWTLVNTFQKNGQTVMEFTRPLITCDDKDVDIKVPVYHKKASFLMESMTLLYFLTARSYPHDICLSLPWTKWQDNPR
jgi:hypothetical protein